MKLPINKIILIAFVVSAISAAVFTVLLVKSDVKVPAKAPVTSNISKKLQNYTPQEPQKNTFNILLLGYGGAGHSGGGLADAQLLLSLNTQTKIATLIAIPRDTWVNLPIQSDKSQYFKINAAYAIGNDDNGYPLKEEKYKGQNGGGNMEKYAVETVTGLPVDYYVSVDFGRLVAAIDALGGITVNVPKTFDDYFYPVKGEEDNLCGKSLDEVERLKAQYSGFQLEKQFTCRYEHVHFDQGPQQIDGTAALKFIRSRHSDQDGGDFARGVREQAVMVGIKDKLLSLDAINKVDDFYSEFSKMVKTDATEDNVVELLSHLGTPNDYEIKRVNISTDNLLDNSTSSDGQYILNPKTGIGNWNEIHKYIENQLNGTN